MVPRRLTTHAAQGDGIINTGEMNMKEICKNCGASKGLHNWQTMQCPLGGREQPVGKPDLWTGETYLEQNDDIDILFARVAELEAQVKPAPRSRAVGGAGGEMKFSINQKVSTPIGSGFIQGRYEGGGWLVRVKISDITKAILSSITPSATISGLWVFESGELK
jgi:hypothetical protein